MATFSLEDLQKAVDANYAPTIVENGAEQFVLQNVFQLPKKTREEIMDLFDKMGEDGYDSEELSRKILIAATQDGKGERLIELIGHNAAMVSELMSTWSTAGQLGEVSAS